MPRTPLALPVLTLLLAACAGARPPDDVVFFRTSAGIAVVRPGTQPPAVRFADAIPSIDGTALVRASRQGTTTRVAALDAVTGAQLWSRVVPGDMKVAAASIGARVVALSSADQPGPLEGRSRTVLRLVGNGLSSPRKVRVAGNIEPEAFSTDGHSLFVAQFHPAEAPTSYQVRRLDLRTEQIGAVYTPDADLQERMQGTARVQAASPDGTRLYTLYSHRTPDGRRYAFVHVLSLDELWAHCVDLPEAFADVEDRAAALTVAPDGLRLDVADALSGTVAEIDTQVLRVVRTSHVVFGTEGAPVHAAGGPDGTLYLGSGTSIAAVDRATLQRTRTLDLPGRVTGIQPGADGRRLYVSLPDRILVLDPRDGRTLEDLSLQRVGAIDRVAPAFFEVEDDEEIICAC